MEQSWQGQQMQASIVGQQCKNTLYNDPWMKKASRIEWSQWPDLRPSSLVLRDNPAAIIEEEEEEEGDESTDRDPLMGGCGTRQENGHPPVIISSGNSQSVFH